MGATEVVAPGQAAAEFGESAEQAPAPDDAEAAARERPNARPPATDLVAPADGADPAARADADEAEASPAPAAPPKPAPKPVVAVRGDDRPGNKKAEAVPAGRGGGKFGDRRDSAAPGGPGGRPGERAPRAGDRGAPAGGGRFGDRPPRFEDRGPRLGDAAFRAQREALERAELALRKLAAQAHGEALTQVLGAWEQRDAAQAAQRPGTGPRGDAGGARQWSQALGAAPAARPTMRPKPCCVWRWRPKCRRRPSSSMPAARCSSSC